MPFLYLTLRSSPRPEQPRHFCKRRRSIRNKFPGVHFVGCSLRFNKRAQIHARLAVWRQAHHLPLVAIALKPEVLRELTVKISDRVRKRNRQYVLDPPVSPMPNRSRFPRPPPIHHNHYSIIKFRKRIRAERMRKMMLHKSHARIRRSKNLHKAFRTALLMPHAHEMQRRVQPIHVSRWHFPRSVAL